MKRTGFSLQESLVRFAISHITAIILLAHAGAGCYWHHSHIYSEHLSDLLPDTTAANLDHPHHHFDDGHDHPVQDPPASHPHHSDTTQVTFLLAEPTTPQKDDLESPRLVDMVLPATSPPPADADFNPGHGPSPRADGLPVRTHLLLAVMLI